MGPYSASPVKQDPQCKTYTFQGLHFQQNPASRAQWSPNCSERAPALFSLVVVLEVVVLVGCHVFHATSPATRIVSYGLFILLGHFCFMVTFDFGLL